MVFLFLFVLDKPPWWDVAWSTWLLAFLTLGLLAVGVIATILALKTLRDLKEQTGIARTAADAALKNAEAVVIAERAWIMVELEWIPGYPKVVLGDSSMSGPSTSAAMRFLYSNEGKTIAWIDEKLACFQIVKDLPKEPDFSALQNLDLEPEWVEVKGGGHIDETLHTAGREGMGDL